MNKLRVGVKYCLPLGSWNASLLLKIVLQSYIFPWNRSRGKIDPAASNVKWHPTVDKLQEGIQVWKGGAGHRRQPGWKAGPTLSKILFIVGLKGLIYIGVEWDLLRPAGRCRRQRTRHPLFYHVVDQLSAGPRAVALRRNAPGGDAFRARGQRVAAWLGEKLKTFAAPGTLIPAIGYNSAPFLSFCTV